MRQRSHPNLVVAILELLDELARHPNCLGAHSLDLATTIGAGDGLVVNLLGHRQYRLTVRTIHIEPHKASRVACQHAG